MIGAIEVPLGVFVVTLAAVAIFVWFATSMYEREGRNKALRLQREVMNRSIESLRSTSVLCSRELQRLQQELEDRGICELVADVLNWGRDRGILTNSTGEAQIKKSQEELDEIKYALALGDSEGIKDGIGDTTVTLILAAACEGFEFVDCLAHAYEQIKDRKGFLNPEGIFVKEEA